MIHSVLAALGICITNVTATARSASVSWVTDQPPPYLVAVFAAEELGMDARWPLSTLVTSRRSATVQADFGSRATLYVQVFSPGKLADTNMTVRTEAETEALYDSVKDDLDPATAVVLPAEDESWDVPAVGKSSKMELIGDHLWGQFVSSRSPVITVGGHARGYGEWYAVTNGDGSVERKYRSTWSEHDRWMIGKVDKRDGQPLERHFTATVDRVEMNVLGDFMSGLQVPMVTRGVSMDDLEVGDEVEIRTTVTGAVQSAEIGYGMFASNETTQTYLDTWQDPDFGLMTSQSFKVWTNRYYDVNADVDSPGSWLKVRSFIRGDVTNRQWKFEAVEPFGEPHMRDPGERVVNIRLNAYIWSQEPLSFATVDDVEAYASSHASNIVGSVWVRRSEHSWHDLPETNMVTVVALHQTGATNEWFRPDPMWKTWQTSATGTWYNVTGINGVGVSIIRDPTLVKDALASHGTVWSNEVTGALSGVVTNPLTSVVQVSPEYQRSFRLTQSMYNYEFLDPQTVSVWRKDSLRTLHDVHGKIFWTNKTGVVTWKPDLREPGPWDWREYDTPERTFGPYDTSVGLGYRILYCDTNDEFTVTRAYGILDDRSQEVPIRRPFMSLSGNGRVRIGRDAIGRKVYISDTNAVPGKIYWEGL